MAKPTGARKSGRVHSQSAVEKFLESAQKTEQHKFDALWAKREAQIQTPPNWYENLGRTLPNYARVHTYLLNTFGKIGLKGKNITHLGAAAGQYCDFLAHHYGAKTIAVDQEIKYLKAGRESGFKTTRLLKSVDQLTRRSTPIGKLGKGRIPPESQDVILSDHFLQSHYAGVGEEFATRETINALKKGGYLIIERAAYLPPAEIHHLFSKYGVELVHQENEGRPDSKHPKEATESNKFYVFRKL